MMPKLIIKILNYFLTKKSQLVLVVTRNCHLKQTLSPEMVTRNEPKQTLLTKMVTEEKHFAENWHPRKPYHHKMAPGKNLATKIYLNSEWAHLTSCLAKKLGLDYHCFSPHSYKRIWNLYTLAVNL